jgi:hypothetical protein
MNQKFIQTSQIINEISADTLKTIGISVGSVASASLIDRAVNAAVDKMEAMRARAKAQARKRKTLLSKNRDQNPVPSGVAPVSTT